MPKISKRKAKCSLEEDAPIPKKRGPKAKQVPSEPTQTQAQAEPQASQSQQTITTRKRGPKAKQVPSEPTQTQTQAEPQASQSRAPRTRGQSKQL